MKVIQDGRNRGNHEVLMAAEHHLEDHRAAVGVHHHCHLLGLEGGVLLTQLHHSLEREELVNLRKEQVRSN